MKKKLDATDFKILSLLADDAQMPYTVVAKKTGISSGTVNMRMNKMLEMSVVKGATLNMDYAQMGWPITVFIGIHLDKSSSYKKVMNKLRLIPEVVKIHHVTGRYGVFIKIHATGIDHYRKIYQDKILTIKGINLTESFTSLEENLNRHILFEF